MMKLPLPPVQDPLVRAVPLLVLTGKTDLKVQCGDRCWRVLLFHREVLVVGPLERGALLHSTWEILQEEDEYG